MLASTTPATSTAALATSTLPPVVLMHGMGDAGTSEGMRSVAEAIRQAFPGRHVVSLDVANGMDSALVTMDAQVAAIAAAVAADKRLAGGFDAVGLSQGALLMRAFVERHGGDYKVRKLFSLCGPQEGIGRCPQVAMYQALCPVFEMDPYGAEVPIAFSGYWKDVRDEKAYLEHNHFLPDVNNERPRRNETYRENMLALEAYVLVHATADSMIVPRESELHGFFAWGDTTRARSCRWRRATATRRTRSGSRRWPRAAASTAAPSTATTCSSTARSSRSRCCRCWGDAKGRVELALVWSHTQASAAGSSMLLAAEQDADHLPRRAREATDPRARARRFSLVAGAAASTFATVAATGAAAGASAGAATRAATGEGEEGASSSAARTHSS